MIPKGGELLYELPMVQLDYTTIGSWTILGFYVLGLVVGASTPVQAKRGHAPAFSSAWILQVLRAFGIGRCVLMSDPEASMKH